MYIYGKTKISWRLLKRYLICKGCLFRNRIICPIGDKTGQWLYTNNDPAKALDWPFSCFSPPQKTISGLSGDNRFNPKSPWNKVSQAALNMDEASAAQQTN